MGRDWFENDELFRRELAIGHRYAELAAERLREAGLMVEVTPMEFRDSIERRTEFADEFDLRVGTTRPVVVDVKSRRERFTGPADFPYDSAFVDTVAGWDAKVRKPVAIVLVSQITEALAVIPMSSEPHWSIVVAYDRVRKIQDRFYAVPCEHLRMFDELVGWLRSREETELPP